VAEAAEAAIAGRLPLLNRPPRPTVSRLDPDTWRTIRYLYRAGTTQVALFRRYGIAQGQISVMCSRGE